MFAPIENNRLYLQTLAMGVVAGLSSALIFASILTQSSFALLITIVAPLPLLIASMGWTTYAGAFAIAIAGIVLSLFTHADVVYAFLMMIALPSSILAAATTLQVRRLTLQHDATTGQNHINTRSWWLSSGVLLVICVVLASIMIVMSAIRSGSYELYTGFLRKTCEALIRFHLGIKDQQPIVLPDNMNVDDVLSMMVSIIPVCMGLVMTLYLAFNVWMGARLVAMSGRLPRPLVSIHQLALPREMTLVMIVSAGLSILPEYFGFLGRAMTGAILGAFIIQGAVALHVLSSGIQSLTLGVKSRTILLGLFYATLFLLPWAILFVAIYGFITILARKSQGSQDPPSPPTPQQFS